jgi:glycosyltransferase involved in cell wall biosynthesis
MKVLFLITRAEMGGGQVHVLDLIRGMLGSCEPMLGVGEEGFLADAVRALGVRVHVLQHLVQPTQPLTDLRAVGELVALLRQERPDLLHAHTSKAGTVGRLAARLTGVPAVFTAHSWAFSEGTSWKWKAVGVPMEFAAAYCCSKIINVSEANRQLARRYRVGRDKQLVTVHNGIPDSGFRSEPGEDAECRIIMVARFAAQKDQLSLVRALAAVRSPYRLLLVGDGPTRGAVEAETARLGMTGRVEFLGERLDVPSLLASAHVFALATHYEGFPISILEAMRTGLPVVSTDVGGVSEAITDGVSGYLIPHGDLDLLTRRLEDLAASPALRARLGAASRRTFEEHFQLAAMVRKTLDVFRSVVATRPADRRETVGAGTTTAKEAGAK